MARCKGLKHLVFEPDGPMLQLPPYLLVSEPAGRRRLQARHARAGARSHSTSPASTGSAAAAKCRSRSARAASSTCARSRPSRARQAYLGLGENAVATGRGRWRRWPTSATGRSPPGRSRSRPTELRYRRSGVRRRRSGEVITGAAFTDTALLARPDLDEYRILHFATHGLVTAPRPECPARPALVTSFGGEGSDGLLSFSEIFDLRLDADVVILSACDTAGTATAAAAREAGIATGGNYALDGLVRAFVGAGARSVVASHWPVPGRL